MADTLSCDGIDAFYGSLHVLKSLSLAFDVTGRTAIFGHNGSGKSTLLKCCVGAVDRVEGDVWFQQGRIIPGNVPHNVHLGIGLVPQVDNVFKALTVERNLYIAGLRRRNDDLAPIWDQFPLLRGRRLQLAGTMSGGEQQLLAFGMALMTRPRMLLLDEPTTGLSPVMAVRVLETMQRISTELQIGVLIIEHNVQRTLRYVDRAVILKSGRIVTDTSAGALIGHRDMWAAF